MSHIARIYEALLNRREKVCHKSEILEIISEYNRILGNIDPEIAIKYLSRQNYIKRVFLHFFYINSADERKRGFCIYEDKEVLFIVLNKLGIKWYLGLNSALYSLGKIWQTPNTIAIINNKISGVKKILGITIKFIKINELLIFGLIKRKTKKRTFFQKSSNVVDKIYTLSTTKNSISYSFSDLSKTYLDFIYLKKSRKLIRGKKTEKYIKRYPQWIKKLI